MEFYQAVKRRRSVRRYRPDPVSDETLQRILEAGHSAPSFANRQPWLFVVVRDAAMKQFVREHCEEVEQKTHSGAAPWFRAFLDDTGLTPEKRFLGEAPVLVLVFGERGAPFWRESCWMAIAQLALAAAAEGLACLTYTPGRIRGARKRLGVPRKFALQAILPIGTPVVEGGEGPVRKPLSEVLLQH